MVWTRQNSWSSQATIVVAWKRERCRGAGSAAEKGLADQYCSMPSSEVVIRFHGWIGTCQRHVTLGELAIHAVKQPVVDGEQSMLSLRNTCTLFPGYARDVYHRKPKGRRGSYDLNNNDDTITSQD